MMGFPLHPVLEGKSQCPLEPRLQQLFASQVRVYPISSLSLFPLACLTLSYPRLQTQSEPDRNTVSIAKSNDLCYFLKLLANIGYFYHKATSYLYDF